MSCVRRSVLLCTMVLLAWLTPADGATQFYFNDQESTVTFPGGARSSATAYQGAWSERFVGDNGIHELVRFDESSRLPNLDSGEQFTIFRYSIWINDNNDGQQRYKLGVRFARNNDGWQESGYFETADMAIGEGWQQLSIDLAALVNEQVAAGYTHISRISIRAYNGSVYSDFYIDNVLLEYQVGPLAGQPPRITSHPASVVRQVGDRATFSVAATGTPPLSYQWYREDEQISGATAPSYTTPTLSLNDDGTSFHCVVRNDFGSATSNSALLRIVPRPPGIVPGDVDGSGVVDLADTIRALQVQIGVAGDSVRAGADVNRDGKVGGAETIFPLQEVARPSGSSSYMVMVGAGAGEAERFAADELVRYLQGANIQVEKTTSYDPAAGPYIIVGTQNPYAAALSSPPDFSQLGEDGFVFHRDGDNLLIAGARDRGTLNGVYQYLRELVGYEWYALDTMSTPRFANGTAPPLPPVSRMEVPRFRFREVFNPEAGQPENPTDGDFAARIQLNGQLGHKTDYLYQDNGEEFYHQGLLRARHGFGVNTDNDRITYRLGNNPGTADTTLDEAVNFFRDGARYRAVEQQTGLWYPRINHIDGGSRSHDPADEALIAANGGAQGAPLMYLTGRIADSLGDEFPEAVFLGEAYLWSLQPPTNISLPANAGVAFAPIEADWGQPLDGGNNTRLYNYLQEWSNHTDHIWTWLYITNFSGYLQPLPNIYPLIDTIKRMATIQDLEGIFLQDSAGGGSFAALHTWVFSRLMWDPTLDGDQLVREFCNGYYGPDAGPIIYQYIQDLHESLRNHPSRIDTKTGPALPYLNAAFVIHADQLMQTAEEAAAGNDLFLKHVRIERMGVDWVILLNGPQLRQEAMQQGLAWPDATEEQRMARVDRFSNTVQHIAAMESFGEGMGTVEDMLASFQYPRVLPPQPVNCAAGGCIDIQDFNFQLSEAQIVHDPLASDHGAARMVGNTSEWGIQVPFSRLLPQTGEWDIYAVVRVEPGEGADENAVAINVGVDPTLHYREIALKALADGRYHTLRLTGSPYSYDPYKYVWLSPPDSDTIRYMYVDRIYAVPAGRTGVETRCPAGSGFTDCRMQDEYGLELFMELSSLVADSSAENGWAAYMHGGFDGWGIQADLHELLPESGQWDVYAAVRIDRLGEVDDSSVAFTMGIDDGESTVVRVGDLGDEQYHLLRLPGGPFDQDDPSNLYFLPANSNIALYVDYLLAVSPGGGTDMTPALASAFLARATYGPTMEEIQALAESDNLEGWIEDQFTRTPCYQIPWIDAGTELGRDEWVDHAEELAWAWQDAWWHCSVDGEDQLRQRLAFALSEIFVVSAKNSGIINYSDGLANYYDLLVRHAFDNFRTLLKAVARNPMMGVYLSHFANARARGNEHPDENFAREVMQLFTIGLYELNQDGTFRLRDGERIPTYTQQDVSEMARVFTGWSSDNGMFDYAAGMDTFHARTAPMVAFEEEHDTGAKTVLGHTLPAGQTAEQDLDAVVEILTTHPNTGPFIARRLIQRLVTSNPSPAYIGRVAAAFNDNGAGVRGDMKAVVKAILLDPEALHGAELYPETFGKLREPLLFLTNLWRTFHASKGVHTAGPFSYQAYGYRDSAASIPQRPLHASTVFNFFTPDDRPTDLVDGGGNPLYAPELTVLPYVNIQDTLVEYLFERGEYNVDEVTATPRLDEEVQLLENGEEDALVERLNILLMGGHMGDDLRQMIRQQIDYDRGVPITDADFIVRDLIGLVMTSSQYAVQR